MDSSDALVLLVELAAARIDPDYQGTASAGSDAECTRFGRRKLVDQAECCSSWETAECDALLPVLDTADSNAAAWRIDVSCQTYKRYE